MGVNSLWDIIGPTAKPVRLEALSRKKLAVDASIWIYQFLKAMRDSKGNALPQSHIIGFFRRICKLLYYGILPVFVFDGGAPALKRQTIAERKERRQDKTESTLETAKKLLAMQLHRSVDRRMPRVNGRKVNGEDENMVYLEDLQNGHPQQLLVARTEAETPDGDRRFIQKDEYHLPVIKEFKVHKYDTRIIPEDERKEYVNDSYNQVDGIDIHSVDPNSEEFLKLKLSTQYMILSHLRLNSRLRMGFNKDQLQDLFPDSMEFSRFQINQVQKRNFYTQKLMNVSGMGGNGNVTRRIAGDKDRNYALVRNDDGWTLSLDGNGTSAETPIALDEENPVKELSKVEGAEEEEDDADWDDVPLDQSPEDGEDMETQKAILQSIYDNYNDEPNLAISQNDSELKKAIEDSKKDFNDLMMKEKKLDKQGLLHWSSNLSDGSKVKTPTVGKSKSSDVPQTFPKLSLNNSMLFNPKPVSKAREQALAPLSKTSRNKDRHASEVQIQKNEVESNNEKFSKEIDGLEEIDFDENDQEGIEDQGDQYKKEDNTIPDWFQSDVTSTMDLQALKLVGNTTTETKGGDESNNIGLISWNEAQELLESDSDSEDVVQVMEDNNQTSPAKYHDENSLDDKNELFKKQKKKVSESNTNFIASRDTSGLKKERKPTIIDYNFEEDDEERLMSDMRTEEDDYENFRTFIISNHDMPSSQTGVTDEQLLQEKLMKAKRDSDEVTDSMIRDVQELLKRFGIPFITAPMEAEAQCAELLKLNLVDGIITDDSDCFLFGGNRIYKNMFNQKQYVECYFMEDIDSQIGLNQDKLIELALLLGSDYTTGIKGIGPVLAMEILATFGSLQEFKGWFDETLKHPRLVENEKSTVKKNLVGRIKNGKLFLSSSFPDQVVFEAYKKPETDKDETRFKWGVPNLNQIRSFLMYNVRWSQEKVDEVMIPLIRDMNRKRMEGTQSTIGEFFPQEYISTRKEIIMGKRLKSAANKLNKRKKT